MRSVSSSAIAVLVLVFTTSAVSTQEFGYYGDTGPEFWASLSSEWTTCGTGQIQSPVDFGRVTLHARKSRNLSLSYGATTGEIFNNGPYHRG
jgi:carbonic anhydrase